MAASATLYNYFRERMTAGGIIWASHTIKLGLFTSSMTPAGTSNWNGTTGNRYWADLTNEVSSTNTGYTTGGATLGTKTTTYGTNRVRLSSASPQWTAGSANLTARYAVLCDTTDTSSPLILCITLDSSDVTVNSGGTLTVAPDGTDGWLYV